MIHSLIAQHYARWFLSHWRATEIARTIVPIIQAGGGEVFTYASVEKIIAYKKTAVGVLMEDGNKIKTPLSLAMRAYLIRLPNCWITFYLKSMTTRKILPK